MNDQAAQTTPGAPTRELPLAHLIQLSIYWFGISIIWGGLDGMIIPRRLEVAYPDDFGAAASRSSAPSAVIMAILVQPTVGMISDYTATRWGRRKPYIVIGALLDVVFLIGVAPRQDFLVLLVFCVLLQFSSNFAQGPFQGYVPDLVPAKQVGLASGLMGLMLVLGRIAGVGIGTHRRRDGQPLARDGGARRRRGGDDDRARPIRARGHRRAAAAGNLVADRAVGVGRRRPARAERALAAARAAALPRRDRVDLVSACRTSAGPTGWTRTPHPARSSSAPSSSASRPRLRPSPAAGSRTGSVASR